MVYQGAPVIIRDTVSWWTTAGDNAHSQTDTHTHLSFPSLVIGRGSEDGSGFVKDFVCLCYGLDIDTYWVWS